MEHDVRWKQRFQNYKKALSRLESAVDLNNVRPLTDLEQQGAIKAFEFTFELSWNVMKDYLTMMGIQDIIGSKGAIRQAFKAGLIENGQLWMNMVQDRNLTSHVYEESLAAGLLEHITASYYPEFTLFARAMSERYEMDDGNI